MEINLTDKQVEQMVEKIVREHVLNKISKKVDEVLKEKYHFHQSIANEMRDAMTRVMERKVNESITKKELYYFVDKDKVSQDISDKVLREVSRNISEAIQNTFY